MVERKVGGIARRKFLLGLAGVTAMTSWQLPNAGAYQPFRPFSFAHVTDIYLTNDQPDSFEMTQESQLFLQQLVKELNHERVDFVMFGGDQVQTLGQNEDHWALFLDCLQPLNAAWSFVLGERDVSGVHPVDKNKTYAPDWKELGIKTDASYWSHNPKSVPDVHIIGLDSSLPNTTLGGISGRQISWLKQDLEDNKKTFTMVFVHHPLLPPQPYDGGPPWDDYVIPDAASVREVLGANPQVKMVLSGHVHISKVQVERDLWHISSPSLCVYPCAYRIFNVAPDMVTMETRQIDFPSLIKKARKDLIDSSLAIHFSSANPAAFAELAEGERIDRQALIPMRAGQKLQAYDAKKGRGRDEKDAEPPNAANDTQKVDSGSDNQENPSTAAAPEQKTRHSMFHKREGNAPAAAAEPPPAPSSKSVELEPVKDINAALDKQFHIDPDDASGGGAK